MSTLLQEIRNSWMASHIIDAQFPTQESQQGLDIYQQTLRLRKTPTAITMITSNEDELLRIYAVDCHPLMIRYAITFASQWKSDSHEHNAMVEYLTQLIINNDTPCHCYVGFYQGKPAACGMLTYAEQSALISDVCISESQQATELHQAMKQHLINIAMNQPIDTLWYEES